jgi:hypothetical protein
MKMAQAIRSRSLVQGEPYVSARDASARADDDLGFAAALKIAIPAGLALWIAGIVGLIYFLF